MSIKSKFKVDDSSVSYHVLFDFVDTLDSRLRELNMSRKDFAKKLDLSEGRVSQVFNDPANFTMKKIVEMARALDFKVSLVAYKDPDNPDGAPIFSENFRNSWEILGRPKAKEDILRLEASCKGCDKKWITNNVVWVDFQNLTADWGEFAGAGTDARRNLPSVQFGG